MLSLLWVGLLISFPVFYIYGLLKFLSGSRLSQPPDFNRSLRSFLQSQSQEKTVRQLLAELSGEPAPGPKTTLPTILPPRTPLKAKPVQIQLSNWYSDHSINALLYLGAFLIVVSASIFVGFQWQSFDNVFKALVITVFTLLWFFFGTWFYQMPKLKSAGLIFTVIGSLLIPFSGIAWHRFVFEPIGVSLGVTWLSTSVIALCVYLIMSRVTTSTLFTYLWTSAILSTSLSVVKFFDLPASYYSFAATLTALSLVGIAFLTLRRPVSPRRSQDLNAHNRMLHLTVIFALIAGFSYLASSGSFFTLEAVANLALLSLTYILYYYLDRQPAYAVVAQILALLTVLFGANYLDLSTALVHYLLELAAFSFLVMAYLTNSRSRLLSQATLVVGAVTTILVYVSSNAALSTGSFPFLFSLSTSLYFFLLAHYFNEVRSRYLTNLFLFVAVYHLFAALNLNTDYLPLGFVLVNFGFLAVSFFVRSPKLVALYQRSSLIGSILSSLYAYQAWSRTSGFGIDQLTAIRLLPGYFAVFVTTFVAAVQKRTELFYVSGFALILMYFWHLQIFSIDSTLAFTLPLGFYLLGIAQHRLHLRDAQNYFLANLIGFAILLYYPLLRAFSELGFTYTIISLSLGLLLLIFGISLRQSHYLYAGIAATALAAIAQTYAYLAQLPRWLLTGIVGLAIIAIATFLLLKRQDKPSSQPNPPAAA